MYSEFEFISIRIFLEKPFLVCCFVYDPDQFDTPKFVSPKEIDQYPEASSIMSQGNNFPPPLNLNLLRNRASHSQRKCFSGISSVTTALTVRCALLIELASHLECFVLQSLGVIIQI